MADDQGSPTKTPRRVVGHYDATYGNFTSKLYEKVRKEAFGEDLGQNSWLTAGELQRFMDWLRLGPDQSLLDVACGSGGPSVRVAKLTGCSIAGMDIHEQAIANANILARQEGVVERTAGFYLFVPPGEDERLLREAGLDVQAVVDLTGAMAEIARRRQPWGSRQAADSSA